LRSQHAYGLKQGCLAALNPWTDSPPHNYMKAPEAYCTRNQTDNSTVLYRCCGCVTLVLQANLDKPFYVWGEDALLSWPGAEPALITERDAFMARVLAATATNNTCNAPAFVAEEVRPSEALRGLKGLGNMLVCRGVVRLK